MTKVTYIYSVSKIGWCLDFAVGLQCVFILKSLNIFDLVILILNQY